MFHLSMEYIRGGGGHTSPALHSNFRKMNPPKNGIFGFFKNSVAKVRKMCGEDDYIFQKIISVL